MCFLQIRIQLQKVKKFCLSHKRYTWLVVGIGIVLLGTGLLHVLSIAHQADESYHVRQIIRFHEGSPEYVSKLTMLPGYHYAMYGGVLAAERVFEIEKLKLWILRIETGFFSLLLVLVSFFILREIKSEQRKIAALLFIPILFPFLFLVYTDIFSLALVLGAVYFYLRKNYALSALVGFASLLVRQDNVVWIAMLGSMALYSLYRESNGTEVWSKVRSIGWKKLSVLIPYGLVGVSALLFYLHTGSFVVGDKVSHPSFSFFFGNIYFFLFLFSLTLLPYCLSRVGDMITLWKKRPYLYAVLFTIYFSLYVFLFVADHKYNEADGFLRNLILDVLMQNGVLFILTGIVTYCTVVILWHSVFRGINKPIFFLFTTLFLSQHWLIENRYSLIPLALCMLCIDMPKKVLTWQIIYGAILSAFVVYALLIKDMFFL